ncbi:hypothetical protein HUG17_7923 [Dermatophagoides farinae]|uniref:Uncharacterized protein n=1 Tax=Dermatophagoides farinae TaxID=6954 RepID=A0A9D4NXZ8_DERFA|nr:hypothetical protein HUG17_7923 [Dermatophagoides farinae]
MKSTRRFREKSLIITPSCCSSSSSSGLQNFRTMIDCIEQIEHDNHHYNHRIQHRLDVIKRQLRQHRQNYFNQQKSYHDQRKTEKLLTEILSDIRNNNVNIEMIKQDLNMIKQRQQLQQQQLSYNQQINDDQYQNEEKEILQIIHTSPITKCEQKQVSFPLMISNVENSINCQIELPRRMDDHDHHDYNDVNDDDDLITAPLLSIPHLISDSSSPSSPSSSLICNTRPVADEMESIHMKLKRLRETVKNPRIKKIIFEGQQLFTNDGRYNINTRQQIPMEDETIRWVLHPTMMMCE